MDATSEAIDGGAPAPPRWSRRRIFAVVFSVSLIGATLAPVVQNWRSSPTDSFPLSYYPMFSAKRGETYRAQYIVGLDTHGHRFPISFRYAGNGGFNQTRRQIGRYVNEDRGDQLAKAIAARIAREDQPPLADVATVLIVSGDFRFDDYFHQKKEPISEKIRGIARVDRGDR